MKRYFFPQRQLFLFFIFITALILGLFFFNKRVLRLRPRQFQLIKKTVSLDRKWDFLASDKTGTPLETKITFSLVSAEQTNQIYVKNKPVRTTPDKGFLVLSLELENTTGERVYFYSSDYIRLLGPEGKKFEADFKNPRLEIAPLSTKKDKLVFLVSAGENNFQIQVGEIIGEKETININF